MADPTRSMDALHEHVPLALLIDMLDETGPDSTAIYEQEPADTAWVPAPPGGKAVTSGVRRPQPSDSPRSPSE